MRRFGCSLIFYITTVRRVHVAEKRNHKDRVLLSGGMKALLLFVTVLIVSLSGIRESHATVDNSTGRLFEMFTVGAGLLTLGDLPVMAVMGDDVLKQEGSSSETLV